MARYPEILAGTRLTASRLNAMIPQFVTKPNHTERSNTTTVTDDPHLQITLSPGRYFVEMFLLLGGSLAGDIKTAWTSPAGVSGLKSVIGPSTTANNANADQITARMGVHNLTTEILYSGVRDGTTLLFRAYEYAELTVTVTATIALQWAQGTSTATASRVASGSVMRVTQIGAV